MTYPMPTMEMTEEDCLKDFNKLKGTWVHDILREGEWFARSEEGYDYPLNYNYHYGFKHNSDYSQNQNYHYCHDHNY